jgi:predicted benzoate:H+ symporter BenE
MLIASTTTTVIVLAHAAALFAAPDAAMSWMTADADVASICGCDITAHSEMRRRVSSRNPATLLTVQVVQSQR